jgi:hypothetical protein
MHMHGGYNVYGCVRRGFERDALTFAGISLKGTADAADR